MSGPMSLGAAAPLPNLTDGEARAFGYALRTLKASRVRGTAETFYRGTLRSSTVRTNSGVLVEFRRSA